MYTEMPFADWYEKVKSEYSRHGLDLPEDIEIMELAHMECAADEKSINDFIEEIKAEQGK